jgi:DNA repair protein RecN (Recombination protein N)
MLKYLHIENIAVVKRADISFGDGFSVLTGETGAGKSVIIDSINMLTGSRVSKDIIRAGEDYALAEAVFDDPTEAVCRKLSELGIDCEDGEIVLSGKITSDGKSNVRINGRALTKSALREIAKMLISIHGQNDGQLLFSKNAYVAMIDSYGDCTPLFDAYSAIYTDLEINRKRLCELTQNEEEKARRRDMLEYQIKDIDSKKLRVGEEEALEEERIKLSNLEKINKHLNFAHRVLSGGEKGNDVAYMLSRASDALAKISDIVPNSAAIAEKLTEMSYEVSDISEQVKELASSECDDPEARLDKIETRLEAIASLKKRYGRDIDSILAFRDNAARELDDIVLSDERAQECTLRIEELKKRAQTASQALTKARKTAAASASEKIMDVLSYLDMPKVKFEIRVSDAQAFTSTGRDIIEFLAATNPGEPMMPIGDIASGGEMARIMLAIKSILNEKDGVSCSVYDEIDTGISGKTSRKIGVKLHAIAEQNQVICVTHSAQIATLADNHYLISKEEIDGRAHTSIQLLDEEQRVEEAARILGGINITDAQRQAARDMLAER